ncbi:hypothetical protein E4T39_03715 [Aureobasidium subglaciale]|nr:hypothetical protein E4T39_03715 [Aureobasidium subglaciale]
MGDFLTAVSSVSLRSKPHAESHIIPEALPNRPKIRIIRNSPTSVEEVLQILRSSPAEDVLNELLSFLTQGSQKSAGFDVRTPTPASAKVVTELINTTLPDFWGSDCQTDLLLIECLRSVAGIGAALAKLRFLISQHRSTQQVVQRSESIRPLSDTISVFSQLLNSDSLAQDVYSDIDRLIESQTKRTLLWKEFLTLIGTGKILATTAEAEDAIKAAGGEHEPSWLSDGSKYSAWLGRNVCAMMRSTTTSDDTSKAAAQLCGKALGIGYPVRVVEEIHAHSTFSSPDAGLILQSLLQGLQVHEQTQFLNSTFKVLSKRSLLLVTPPDFEDSLTETPSAITATSTAITNLIGSNELVRTHLETWLADPVQNASESFALRRAAVSAFVHACKGASNMLEDPVQDLVEKTLKRFGDNLFIKHSPILQQEACAQILLLVSGYAHRAQPMSLFIMARSSAHLNGMSNRLNSSSPRARFLGMVVGMAISDLVDKPGSKMDFDIDDLKTAEGKWYQRLVKVNDEVGSYTDIKEVFEVNTTQRSDKKTNTTTPRPTKAPAPPKAKVKPLIQEGLQGPRIMEVLDDSDEDDDLIPYAKPDSDPEDEDDDPTMINRDKPKAPVYIRDLMAGLNDSENYDKHSLALNSAAALIRRKTLFGKEVSDHALELASILVGLGDTFDMDNFLELRLQALIAVLVASPAEMAPWFARQVFDGDYSLSQRTTILSVLGLGARELAGYKDEDEELNPTMAATSFPSKQLPERLHKMYAAERNAPVALIASKLERSMIQPMALDAADKLSGPNILKVRTFSSRMEVERKRKKTIPNALAKMVAERFFFPLTGRWWQNLQAYGSENVHFQPFLLSTYLKTLALILHASGAGTISLPQMTAEFWELILSVRTKALTDVSVLEAVLFATLTLLDMNEDKRRLAEEHSKQLIETQEWVELVFDRVGGGDEEGERIRMLAASVLMKTREVVDKYQRLLVGDLVDY